MSDLEIILIPCLSDNYGFLMHDPASGETVSVDAPEAGPILRAAENRGWGVDQIWITHHHHDHVGGAAAIKAQTGARILGPRKERDKIGVLDEVLEEGDTVSIGEVAFSVMETPGHTLGHIVYASVAAKIAFVGDALFAMGCGRLFEGDARAMWSYLARMRDWSKDMLVHCAHEYTLKNLDFALSVDPENKALQARAPGLRALRDRGEPTVPVTMADEIATNPFLRADDPILAGRTLAEQKDDPVQVFAALRAARDRF